MRGAILTQAQLSVFDFGKGFGMDVHSSEEIARTFKDLQAVQGNALIIGGMAVIHYGYKRYTHDIDILYSNYEEAALVKRLKKDFKIVRKAESGWHHFTHKKTGVRLELIPEGGLTTYGFIPGPKTVGRDGEFISLFGLVWLKLVSGRAQDNADIVVLAKHRMPEMRALTEKLPPELRERYKEALLQAQKEIDTDPNIDHDEPESETRAKEAPAQYGAKKRTPRRKVAKSRKPAVR